MFDLTGRIALVTGSSRGIGLAIAAGLVRAGATVVLNGVNPERLERSRAELARRFEQATVAARAFDVTIPDHVRDGIGWIEATVGPIEILVNNAGLQHREPLLKISLQDWNRVLTTDLTSALINGIASGYIHTEMTQSLVDDLAFNTWILGRTPAARWGTVDDLTGPAVFLASQASNFVNGQVLFVDGGMTAVV
jgi:gluconate 5-dehydrogenase